MQFRISKDTPFLRVVSGPMFSGKSQEIDRITTSIYYYNLHQSALDEPDSISYIILRPDLDTRDDSIRTLPYANKNWDIVSIDDINKNTKGEELDIFSKYDYVIIDEAQFFSSKVTDQVKRLLHNNKFVIVAGLDKDYRGEPFSEFMKWSMCVADDVIKLNAICVECGEPSTMAKLVTLNGVEPTDNIVIEDENHKYVAMCRRCMNAHN